MSSGIGTTNWAAGRDEFSTCHCTFVVPVLRHVTVQLWSLLYDMSQCIYGPCSTTCHCTFVVLVLRHVTVHLWSLFDCYL